MDKQVKAEIKNWLMDMRVPNPYASTINLKTGDRIVARKHLGFFRNRYERGIGKRNKSYFFIPVLESGPHLHYHLITNRPEEISHTAYLDMFHKALSKTKQIHNNYNVVKPVQQLNRWASYMTKFKNEHDDIDWINLKR